jgi:hypothetical protein
MKWRRWATTGAFSLFDVLTVLVLRHSREGGNPYARTVVLEARGLLVWIPAGAGMTAWVGAADDR